MQKIWQFSAWLPYEIDVKELVANCRFINSDEVFSAGMNPGRSRDTPFPVPELELSLPSFSVDCFTWEAHFLVSERMRAALALPDDEVEYFPVDASRSAAVPRSMNYQVMSVAVTDHVSYPQPEHELEPGLSHLISSLPGSDDIDVNFQSEHRLFFDESFIGTLFCTDELAMSVLRAGCTGVRFLDPRHSDITRPMRFRTLRGIEEEGVWDPVHKVEHSTLVEAAPET